MATFAQTLLRIYDKKLFSGQTTFSTSGIQKGDFNEMCTDASYIIPLERTKVICEKMKLNEEEIASLMSFYNQED